MMMNKGLGRLALLLGLTLLSAPAWAGSTLVFTANGGAPTTYTDSNGTFGVGGNVNTGVQVNFDTNSGNFHFAYLDLAAPSGKALTPGIYDGAQRWPFQAPTRPGLSFDFDGEGCDALDGRFVVRAITTDGTGKVTSLAVDFIQDCLGIVGSYRFNDSTPIPYPHPTADAGTNQLVTAGALVTLDGSLSDAGPSPDTITGYIWTQLSGTSVALSDTSAVKPTFTAPDVALGGEDLTFQLEVENSLADSATGTVTVHVSNPADPLTILDITQDPTEFLPAGRQTSLNTTQALFTPSVIAATSSMGSGVQIAVNAGTSDSWSLRFMAPKGQVLQVGSSYDVFTGPAPASMSVAGSCGVQRFVVLDLQTDVNGKITAFAADFDQECGGTTPALHGKVRYNSTVPLDVAWADAGVPQQVVPGIVVTLSSDGSSGGDDGETVSSYQWVQISGPSVTLSDPNAANPTFSAPAVSAGGADLVFQLTVTSSDGLTSTDTVTVHVAGLSDSTSTLMVTTQTQDPASTSSVVLDPLTTTFSGHTLSGSTYNGPGVWFSVNGRSGNWTVEFVAPVGQTLHTGTYDLAQVYPWGASSSPGISISGPQSACYGGTGQFTILDIQTSGSSITSFAAVFQQNCGSTILSGKITYASAISIYQPSADAGSYQATVQGDTVQLSAAASDAGGPGATISNYQWTQLSGPSVTLSDVSAEAPTFTAPSVGPGGEDLVFQVTITNFLGLTSSATVKVHVAALTDPAPATRFYAVSDPGDSVGQGQTYDISGAQEAFTVSKYGSGYELMVGDYDWLIELVPPQGQTLQVGQTYKLAQRYPFQSPVLPGLSVEHGGCNTLSGRFVILDVETDQFGKILSFAADFEQHCEGAVPALHGAFRYNSGVSVSAPYADAGPAQIVLQGATVQLDGSKSYTGGGADTITSFQWTQLAGPSVGLSDATAAAPSFTAPDVSAGGTDLVFQLTVSNSESLSSSDTVTIHVANPADPITAIHISGDQGDWVSQGKTWYENTLVAKFTPNKPNSNNPEVHMDVEGGDFGQWDLDFAPPSGQPLQNDFAYLDAQRYPFQGSGPGLNVDGNGAGCNTLDGKFIIKDLQVAGDGTVLSFAADFEQRCDGATSALYGKIRYNSTFSLDDPVAVAGPEQAVTQGDTVTLSGGASDPGGDGTTITSWQWTQISGPSVDLSGADTQDVTFIPGDVPPGGETLVFQLTITNSLGLVSTEDVTVLVANPADPQTGIYLQGIADQYGEDSVKTLLRQPLDGSFTATTPSANAVTVGYTAPDGKFWNLTFVPPQGQKFHVGTYANVSDAAPPDPSSPADIGATPGSQAQMLITDRYFYNVCQTVGGQFTVEQVTYDDGGNVTAFAADFKQTCDGSAATLRGKVRYQSTVTLREPLADAGDDQLAFSGFDADLDGSASSTPFGTLTAYQWTQVVNNGDPVVVLVDPTAAKPRLAAPDLATGRTLTFRLTVTNSLGLSDSDTVHVTLVGQNDPKTGFYYQSDADDPDGQGAARLATSSDGELYFRGFNWYVASNIYPNGATPFDQYWEFGFSAGDATLQKGVYPVGPYQPVHSPSLVATAGACDQTGGLFVIRDISFDNTGRLGSFAADFVRHCQGATGTLRGALRYNSVTPMKVDVPAAYAGPAQNFTEAATVTLDGSLSFPGWGKPTYSWRQVAGPTVSIIHPTSAIAHFVLPPALVTVGGNTLKFTLTVTSASGKSSSATTTVTVRLSAISFLELTSDAGDPIGGGGAWSLAAPAASFHGLQTAGSSVQVSATQTGGNWAAGFRAPAGQQLAVGTYNGATKYSTAAGPSAQLFVDMLKARAPDCHVVSGSFTVLDILYVPHGALSSLAVDFSQTCDGAAGALHGKLRYHSAVP